ncbi:hypothetical protein [Gracilimonas tropica]|uniref:hypothetical protein n=1 Tax=Gracilimonas tropica TaxID=454600 RepID=UPI0003691EF8|nr:hypothetical protein [Gracilimonas tropica]
MSFKNSNIQDAYIISETLHDGENEVIDFIARQAEKITKNHRGSWVTEALALADLAKDNDGLRSAYNQNKEALDQYFSHVDVEKTVRMVGPDFKEQVKLSLRERAKNNLPGFAIGFVTGAFIFALKKSK